MTGSVVTTTVGVSAASQPNAANNGISLSLPTDVFGDSGDTFNFGYNFGGSTQDMANAAYAFLASSNSTDQNFVSGAINGSQSFLAGQTSPIVAGIAQTQSAINAQLPTLFGDLSGEANLSQQLIASLTGSAISAQSSIAQASINASAAEAQNSGGGGGLCFITTAVCDELALPDDNPVLCSLRAFRDNVMLASDIGAKLVQIYYRVAPRCVAAIDKRKDSARIYSIMLRSFILPAVNAIAAEDYALAFELYRQLVLFAAIIYARSAQNES